MRPQVVVVGSANLDLVALTVRLPNPGETVLGTSFFEAAGGKGLNQAVAAARMGARVSMIAALGRDHAGDTLLEIMRENEIQLDGVSRVDEPTGRALIGVDDAGQNLIIVVPGANAMVSPVAVTVHGGAIAGAQVVLAQQETPQDVTAAAFRTARAVGTLTILNPAPVVEVDTDVLQHTDIIVPNEHEVELLGGVATLIAQGIAHVVVTLGAQGAAWHHDGQVDPIAPFLVDSIDTVAAGDAFCGALAAALAFGATMPRALRYASAAGALATTVRGAVPSLPRRSAVERLVNDAM